MRTGFCRVERFSAPIGLVFVEDGLGSQTGLRQPGQGTTTPNRVFARVNLTVRCSRLGAVAENSNNKSRTVCFSAQLRPPFSGHRATTPLKSCMLSRLHLKPLPDWAPPRQTGRTTLKIVCLYQQISRRLLSPGRHGCTCVERSVLDCFVATQIA